MKILFALLALCCVTAIVSPAQTFTTIHNFNGTAGNGPNYVSLAQGLNGNFYGTTTEGGDLSCGAPYGCGTVFEVTPQGKLITLHNFESTDGSAPYSGVVLGRRGDFYGTTLFGGDLTCNAPYGCGTVFKITPAGVLTVLHSFEFTDGGYPNNALTLGIDGNLYGSASGGGAYGGYGTIFKITPEGTLTTLHSFNGSDGDGPNSPIQASNGAFYGTVNAGGNSPNCDGGCGTIYKLDAEGLLTTLYNFDSTHGSHPNSTLMQASDNEFYGATEEGGENSCQGDGGAGCGTVFKATLGGSFTTLHDFVDSDGAFPVGLLIQASDGNFYGTTYLGGDLTCYPSYGCGTIFQMAPSGQLTSLHEFDGVDGQSPIGGLLQATNGGFYGTTRNAGAHNAGTVFNLDMGLGPFVTFVLEAGKVGQTSNILGQGFAGATSVSLNGTPMSFSVVSDTFIKATVPLGATTGYVTVATPNGTLTSNVPFRVIP